MKRLTLLAVTSGALVGCAQPVLLKHYKIRDTQIESNLPVPRLVLSVFPSSVKPVDTAPVVLQLDDKAQAELVKVLGGRVPASAAVNATAQSLAGALMTVPSQAASCAWVDKSSMTRRLNITLLGDLPLPADRVDKLEVTLRVNNGAMAQFGSWDRFDSAHFSYNFGTATYTQNNKIVAGTSRDATDTLPAGAGSVLRKLNLNAEHTDSLAETASYAARRMAIGGSLAKNEATLVMEGGPLTNLFGTSNATVTLKLTPGGDNWPVYQLNVERDGKPEPSEVSVQRCQAKVPERSAEVSLSVTGRAWVRQVVEGDDTVTESDDKAHYRSIALGDSSAAPHPPSPLTVPLLSAAETTFDTFGLRRCVDRDCRDLHINAQSLGSDQHDPLQFASIAEANTFRLWLLARTRGGKTVESLGGGRAFGLGQASEGGGAMTLTGVDEKMAGQLNVVRLCSNSRSQRCEIMK